MSKQWSKGASLYDGARAVGGSMSVVDERLRFEPHAFDRALKGREVDFPLAAVGRLTLTKRSLIAPRRHVLIETNDGGRARFLVNGARQVIQDLVTLSREVGAEPEVVGLE